MKRLCIVLLCILPIVGAAGMAATASAVLRDEAERSRHWRLRLVLHGVTDDGKSGVPMGFHGEPRIPWFGQQHVVVEVSETDLERLHAAAADQGRAGTSPRPTTAPPGYVGVCERSFWP